MYGIMDAFNVGNTQKMSTLNNTHNLQCCAILNAEKCTITRIILLTLSRRSGVLNRGIIQFNNVFKSSLPLPNEPPIAYPSHGKEVRYSKLCVRNSTSVPPCITQKMACFRSRESNKCSYRLRTSHRCDRSTDSANSFRSIWCGGRTSKGMMIYIKKTHMDT